MTQAKLNLANIPKTKYEVISFGARKNPNGKVIDFYVKQGRETRLISLLRRTDAQNWCQDYPNESSLSFFDGFPDEYPELDKALDKLHALFYHEQRPSCEDYDMDDPPF